MHYIFLAGIGSSEPEHWQSRWHAAAAATCWVDHADWTHPDRDAWVQDLEAALAGGDEPPLVIAHSLGCLLLGEWRLDNPTRPLAGAFLVAPPDAQSSAFPAAISGFRPAFSTTLDCPAMLVASRDDPYASFDYAERLAAHWRAELVDAGHCGHINLASGLGEWQAGRELLARFEAGLKPAKA